MTANISHRNQYTNTETEEQPRLDFAIISLDSAYGSRAGIILSGIAATVIGVLLATAIIPAGAAVIGLFCCIGCATLFTILAGIASARGMHLAFFELSSEKRDEISPVALKEGFFSIGSAYGSLVGGILSGIAATIIGILLATAIVPAGAAVIGLFCCIGGAALFPILGLIAIAFIFHIYS